MVKGANWYRVKLAKQPPGFVYGSLIKDVTQQIREEERKRREAEARDAAEAKARAAEQARLKQIREEERKIARWNGNWVGNGLTGEHWDLTVKNGRLSGYMTGRSLADRCCVARA